MASKITTTSIIVIVLFIGVAIGGYVFIFKPEPSSTPSSNTESTTPPSATPQGQETDNALKDWQAYQSKEYGFKIKYPPNYMIEEQKEPGEHFIGFGPKEKGTGWGIVVIVVTDPNKSYDEALEEFRKTTGGKLQEKPRSVGGINGIEFKGEAQGQNPLYIIIPYKGRLLGFFAAKPNQTVLDKEAIYLLDIFVSSFVP